MPTQNMKKKKKEEKKLKTALKAGQFAAEPEDLNKVVLPYRVRERHKIATLRVQAVFRGNVGRKKTNELFAARKIEAYIRGWRVRKELNKVVFGWAAYDYAVTQLKKHCKEKNMSIHALFDDLDIDEDGSIQLEELQQFLITHPALDLDDDEIKALVYHLDHNQDHDIGMKEFVHSMLKHEKKVGKIKAKWEQHQLLKRKKASDAHLLQMERNQKHAKEIKLKLESEAKEIKFNLKQRSHYRTLVRQHHEEFHASEIRKQKRLLNGHKSYRQEAELNHRNHRTHIQGAKELALDKLRSANMREHTGFSFNPSSKSSTPKRSLPSSPRGPPSQRRPSPRMLRNAHLKDIQRLSKSWKKVAGQNGEEFYQNVRTHEVAWEIPKNDVLYDPNVRSEHNIWSDNAAPDFEAVFDTLSSSEWKQTKSKQRGRKLNSKNSFMEQNEQEWLDDSVLGISSLRFDSDRWFGPKS